MIFYLAYGAFAVVSIAIFVYTMDVDEEFYDEPTVYAEADDYYEDSLAS